jgi:hypothetical protein
MPYVSPNIIKAIIFIDFILALWPTLLNYLAMQENLKNHIVTKRDAVLNEIEAFF